MSSLRDSGRTKTNCVGVSQTHGWHHGLNSAGALRLYTHSVISPLIRPGRSRSRAARRVSFFEAQRAARFLAHGASRGIAGEKNQPSPGGTAPIVAAHPTCRPSGTRIVCARAPRTSSWDFTCRASGTHLIKRAVIQGGSVSAILAGTDNHHPR